MTADDKSSRQNAMNPSTEARRALVVIAMIFAILAAGAFVMVRKRLHTPPAPPIRSIAVLPFKPVAVNARTALVERQLALAVIAQIESRGELAVTTPAAADAILNGTIDTSGGRVRVVASLFRVADGKEIWQGRFDRPHDQIAALQKSLAEQVIEAAKMR